MLKKKTTFILGAGASAELGLPLGEALQVKIQQRLRRELERLKAANVKFLEDADTPIARALFQLEETQETIRAAFHKVADGIVEGPSIDTFLFNNRHDQLIVNTGKLAIIREILDGEQSSFASNPNNARIYFEHPRQAPGGLARNPLQVDWDTFAVRNSYLNFVWNEACQDHSINNIETIFQNLSVVNFNYDRSFEFVLTRKLKRNFPDLPPGKVRKLIDSIESIRPYGSPSGDNAYSEAGLEYGQNESLQLHTHLSSIRTYTEAVDEKVVARVKTMVQESDIVAILGFGFHKQNVDLIACAPGAHKKIFFSAYGRSAQDIEAIRLELANRIGRFAPTGNSYPTNIHGVDATSYDTLRTFSHAVFRI